MPRNNLKPPGEAAKRQLFHKMKYQSTKERGYVWALSYEEFCSLTSNKCHYCGSEPSQIFNTVLRGKTMHNGDYVYNGIDRIDNTTGYLAVNCVSCCQVCNRAKRAMTYIEFVDWLKTIANKWGKV